MPDLGFMIAQSVRDDLAQFVPSHIEQDGPQCYFYTKIVDRSFLTHEIDIYVTITESGSVTVGLNSGYNPRLSRRDAIKPFNCWPQTTMVTEVPLADPQCLEKLVAFAKKWILALDRR